MLSDSLVWLSPCSCPGEQLVDVSFKTTPDQPSLHIFWSDLTGYAFAAFAFSFLFISLALGIFRRAALSDLIPCVTNCCPARCTRADHMHSHPVQGCPT